jgi:predicted transcriptional regulator
MKTTTISSIPPQIIQSFNKKLLMSIIEISKETVESEIIRLYYKKIVLRPKNSGKRKEFDKLIKEYYEEYERKKTQEEKYKAKIKDSQQRSSISNSSSTMRFESYKD